MAIRHRGDSSQTKGMNHVTLQQIRLWMKTQCRGELYHDRANDPVIEPYFDLSPEATLPAGTPGSRRRRSGDGASGKRPT